MSLDQHQLVDVNNTTLAVSRLGRGRPVLLIHAYPLRRQLYRDVVEDFAREHEVIAVDNRGFGQSAVTAGCVSIEQYADDLVAVLDALSIAEPAIVVGVSMGGYIAMRLAERHEDRVAGLLLCNTRLASDTPEAAAKRETLAQKIEREGTRVIERVPENLVGETGQRHRPELLDELRSWILATDANGVAAALRGMAARPDSTDLVSRFAGPVHFLAGDEDTFTPADEMREMAAATGRSVDVISGSGHLSPIEQPGAFAERACAYFATVPAAS